MIEPRRCTDGDECDAHEARQIYTCFQRPGYAAKIKRRTNRRERREGKADITAQLRDR